MRLLLIMKRLCILFSVLAMCLPCTSGRSAGTSESSTVVLASYETRRGEKLTCVCEQARLLKQTLWDPAKAAIPLDPAAAFAAANKWIRKQHGDPKLLEIRIRRADFYSDKRPGLFYYICEFEAAAFEYVPVVVLMDGTIVEPVKPKENRDPTNSK